VQRDNRFGKTLFKSFVSLNKCFRLPLMLLCNKLLWFWNDGFLADGNQRLFFIQRVGNVTIFVVAIFQDLVFDAAVLNLSSVLAFAASTSALPASCPDPLAAANIDADCSFYADCVETTLECKLTKRTARLLNL
jgi:hypothetical protein